MGVDSRDSMAARRRFLLNCRWLCPRLSGNTEDQVYVAADRRVDLLLREGKPIREVRKGWAVACDSRDAGQPAARLWPEHFQTSYKRLRYFRTAVPSAARRLIPNCNSTS